MHPWPGSNIMYIIYLGPLHETITGQEGSSHMAENTGIAQAVMWVSVL